MDNAKDNALPAGSLLGALATVTCRPRGRRQSVGFEAPSASVEGGCWEAFFQVVVVVGSASWQEVING